jgi:hypothetical protein
MYWLHESLRLSITETVGEFVAQTETELCRCDIARFHHLELVHMPFRVGITVHKPTVLICTFQIIKYVGPLSSRSRDSVLVIATGYGLDDRQARVRILVGSRIFSSPSRPDRFWGPPNLLSNGWRGLFPGGKAAGA